jgi:hypothetical protein
VASSLARRATSIGLSKRTGSQRSIGDSRGRHGEICKLHATEAKHAAKPEPASDLGVLAGAAGGADGRLPRGQFLQNTGNYCVADKILGAAAGA